MRRPQGYGVVFDPLPRAGQPSIQEYDTISCGHCNKIVHVKSGTGSTVYLIPQLILGQPQWKEEMGAMCGCCMRAVCLPCHHVGTCTPLEKRIEQWEARGRFLAALEG